MARVTYVKKAQPRYKTVPVIDPETGQQKVTPVLRRDGSPKLTKAKAGRPGRPITMRVTQEDKSQPLPLRVCDAPGCGKPIEVGTPYKWVKPKSGPYGGRTRARHGDCPTWRQWDLSNSLDAQLARVSHEAQDGVDTTDPSSVAEALRNAAEGVRDIASQKEEGADNIESGFGHETEQSTQLRDTAESLNTWADEMDEKADEVEALEVPDELIPCEECVGGRVSGDSDDDDGVDECPTCGGDGELDNPERETFEGELEEALGLVDEVPL